ncbi:MAG: DUF349 domain-containing protein [Alistipes sp.]|nr:DUF349 domain-containing protein [Alistipes sp.]
MATETTNPAVPEEQTGFAGDAQNETAAVTAAEELPESVPQDTPVDAGEQTDMPGGTDKAPEVNPSARTEEPDVPEPDADGSSPGPQAGDAPAEVTEAAMAQPAEESTANDVQIERAEVEAEKEEAVQTAEEPLEGTMATEPETVAAEVNDDAVREPESAEQTTERVSVPEAAIAEETEETVDFSDEEAQLDIIAAEHPDYDLGEEDDSELAAGEIPAGSEVFDTAGKSKAQLLDMFAVLLAERPVHTIRREVEAVKVAFYKLLRAEHDELRRKFIEEGGQPEDFAPPVDNEEQRLKDLFSEYRKRRDEFIAQLDRSKEENLSIKLKIIEDLKELVNSSETLGNTFNAFRDLQQRWREAGPVPQANVKDLWETYNHHVENFYSYIKINKELRDLDLKKNYEAKVALCEEAEALVLEPSVLNSFHRLQKLHEQWREIGPVAREYKETVWERFKEASSRINKQHQEYFDTQKEEQKRNLELKTELCRKTEELSEGMWTTRKDWNKASDKLLEIQKVWKTIGFAPRKDNARIYEQFRNACDRFFEQKRAFYQQIKAEMDHNLQLKQEICEAAEALQESEDWKKTTEELIAMQKRWKEIGPVAWRHSDAVWKRFRAACDRFFERKSTHFSSRDSEQENNLRMKRKLLEEIAAADIAAGGFDMIKEFQRRWSEIGYVPIKQKDALQKEYKAVMDTAFSTLRDSGQNVRFDRFREKVRNMKTSGDKRLRFERDRLYNKVKQMESEIALLENNIGFFSNSKNAESMIRDVEQKIARTREEMAATIEKINLIDSQE